MFFELKVVQASTALVQRVSCCGAINKHSSTGRGHSGFRLSYSNSPYQNALVTVFFKRFHAKSVQRYPCKFYVMQNLYVSYNPLYNEL